MYELVYGNAYINKGVPDFSVIRVRVYGTCFSYIWWCHQMESFSALPALCVGNLSVAGEYPLQKGQ